MIVEVNGLKVYYEAIGEGEPVVLLHGWGTDSSNMRPILNLVRESTGARVYALDFPGFGFSQRPSEAWDVGSYTSFLIDFLCALEIPPADFICHSFGGRVAIKLAANHPERVKRLVLVDSAGIRPERGFSYRLKIFPVKAARTLVKALPDPLKRFFVRFLEKQGSVDYRNAGPLRLTFVKVINEDLRSCLPVIQAPTLLIWGEKDTETPLSDGRLMHRLIPNSQLEVIKGSGHFPYIDNFPAFRRALTPFLGG